jgi:acyl carrier protein
MSHIRDAIKAQIEDEMLVTYGEDFTDDTNLFEAGIMDSFGYVQLVGFLQETFGVTLNDEDILTNVMVSLARMTEAVEGQAPLAKAS